MRDKMQMQKYSAKGVTMDAAFSLVFFMIPSRMHLLYKASSSQGNNLIDYEIRVYEGARRRGDE